MTYASNLNGYDRDKCPTCGQWMPWPALDDHRCIPPRLDSTTPVGRAIVDATRAER